MSFFHSVNSPLILVCLHFCQVGYREKAREEASRGGSLVYRPDIALATEVSKLTSQVRKKKKVNHLSPDTLS